MSLPELPRTDRLLWSIMLVTAALVALLTWLLLPPEKTGGVVKQPSTFFNVGYGTKAAYLVLDRLEYPVDRLRRPIARETLDGIGCLLILKPVIGLQRFEMVALETWVRQGHALVVAPGWSASEGSSTAGHAAREPEDAEFRRQQGDSFEDWFCFNAQAADLAKTPRTAEEADRPERGTEVAESEPICAGVRHLVAGGDRRFAKPPLRGDLAKLSAKAFWKDERGTVGLRVRCGHGTIVALSDVYPLTNLGISEADNGVLLGNIARELSKLSPGTIAFDEYHLGFAQRDWSPVAMTKLMLSGPWRWAIAQAVLAGMLALYAGGVRFGSPRDVTRKPRRQQREFAEAAGRLLDEAGATSLAVETLRRYYHDRICRALHLEAEADDELLRRAVRDRLGGEASAVFERAGNAASRAAGRQELLTIAQELHRVTETLEHGS
jgi:hypothetical protein